jgi:PAS domain S-box-containing protein
MFSKRVANRYFADQRKGLMPHRLVVGLTTLAVTVILTVAGVTIWNSYDRSLQQARRETSNLTIAVAEQTSRVLETVDLILRRAKQRIEQNETFSSADLAQMLSNGLIEIPQIRRLGVIDAQGIAIGDSTDLSPLRLDLSDREYFKAVRDRPEIDLFVGAPAVSRADGQWSFYAVRRVIGPAGEFRGAVVAVLEPRYFETFYSAILPAPDGAIALYRDDGVLLVRFPQVPAVLGRSFADSNLFRELAREPLGGTFRSVSEVDQVSRLTSFRRVPGYPLVIATSLPESSILAPWRRQALLVGMIALAALAAAFVVHWLLLRHVRLHDHLQASERFFREMAEAMPQIVFFADARGSITYANERWREQTGQPDHTACGFGWLASIHPDDCRQMQDVWASSLESGTECRGEYRLRQADGTYRYFLFLSVPVRDPATNQITRWFGSATDVDELRRTANELRATQERLRFALAAARMFVFERDLGGGEVTRFGAEEIVGAIGSRPTEFYDRIHPEDRPKVIEAFDHAGAGDAPLDVQFRFQGPQGETLWLADKGRVQIEPSSGLKRLTGVTIDITALKQSQEALSQIGRENQILAAAVRATQRGVVVVDAVAEGYPIIFCNPGFTTITGYSEEEVLGRSCHFLLGEKTDPVAMSRIDHALRTGQELAVEVLNYRKDGTVFWNDVRISPVVTPEGQLQYCIGVLDDVTDRREMAAQLLRTNEQLTREVEERKRAGEEAENASRAKSEFLAAMSHEMRTPLHAITGVTGLILDQSDLAPEIRRQVEQVNVSGAALLTVVNDVLDFSKIEAGAVEIEQKPFWAHSLVKDCVGIVSEMAVKKGLVIEIKTGDVLPARLLGDEPRIRQVLLNLLNNAVKFTPAGRIEIALEHESLSTGEVSLHFSVTDTGIGVPEKDLGRLFKRFSQVDGSYSRRYGGTGLGLAISRQLVELMHGEIGVKSRMGEGSTFWFRITLPKCEMGPMKSPELISAGTGSTQQRILLAEDVEINQEIARSVLESAGHQVDIVSDGAEAVMAVQSRAYDLVLMDVQMPIMDGVTATRRIRALPGQVGQIPVVAMTANVFAEQIAAFKEAGMNDHLGKPFKREELNAVVRRWGARAS